VNSARRELQDLADIRATHNAMAEAHERVMGFHLLEPLAKDQLDEADQAIMAATQRVHRPSKSQPSGRAGAGVGHIPALPRPNFLSAIAEFTLGE
jgi:hypothetical protein